MLRTLPLMAIVVVLYNVLVVVAGTPLHDAIFTLTLPSGAPWSLTISDLLIVVGLVLLFVELVSASSSRPGTVVNHALSVLVFVFCIVEFLLVAGCGTSTFFMITLLALLDVVAGFSVTIVAARRDLAVDRLT